MVQQNPSKFAISYVYDNTHVVFLVSHFLQLYFCWNISLSANLLILKSDFSVCRLQQRHQLIIFFAQVSTQHTVPSSMI